ncbi:MAG: hypothetical protein IKM31_11525, partial [Oscillospiraceae bacterium]|nr:hypothetical protein [Oscillospiraceae bacterium]
RNASGISFHAGDGGEAFFAIFHTANKAAHKTSGLNFILTYLPITGKPFFIPFQLFQAHFFKFFLTAFQDNAIAGKHFFRVAMGRPCPTGISYLILQCAADGESKGFCVRSMKKV